MSIKTLTAAMIGSLIALGLLIIRPLRRKELIESEVSALRNLGSGREKLPNMRDVGSQSQP